MATETLTPTRSTLQITPNRPRRAARPTVQPPRPLRWTREEYYRLAETGLFDDRRVELIEGVIYEMAPKNEPHITALTLTRQTLEHAFGGGYWVRTEATLDLGPGSQLEPDIAIVRGGPREQPLHPPTTALLLVEVSDTTLRTDRGRKLRLYAQATIPEYWIVNLQHRQLEVYRDPTPTGYRVRTIYGPDDSVAALERPDAAIKVADLLP